MNNLILIGMMGCGKSTVGRLAAEQLGLAFVDTDERIEAEADAYELTTRAEAEAEANRKIAESLTEALIAYTYAENWNGELPTFMTGDGTTLPMFDMSALLNGKTDNGTTAAQPAE